MEALWQSFVATYGRVILAILFLITADVVTGIASALVRKDFKWETLSNFYLTNILPKLLCWIGLNLVSQAVFQLPELGPLVNQYGGPVMAGFSALAVAATLLYSIFKNALEVMKANAPKQSGSA